MGKIKVMDTKLANTIAAGEVVERPLNIIKELVENAIDANSNNLTIELQESGIKLIKITDNGDGMDPDDAVLCFERNATSKIKAINQINQIETLGFRGEAIPSIAAVSRVKLLTNDGSNSSYVEVEFGEIKNIDLDREYLKGTTFIVTDLFYNMPVRLKHLQNKYRELSVITEFIQKMAIVYPNVNFKLINDGKTIYYSLSTESTISKLQKLYRLESSTKINEIIAESLDYKIKVYLIDLNYTKINRMGITSSFNKRLISNLKIQNSIVAGTNGYRMHERYPIAFILIEGDPQLIDVNIHPHKQQIKISKEELLNILIEKTIKQYLNDLRFQDNLNFEQNDQFSEQLGSDFETINESSGDNSLNFQNTLMQNNSPKAIVEKSLNREVQVINEDNKVDKPKAVLENSIIDQNIVNYIGQFNDSYLLFEHEAKLIIVDQHAAQERINYESILKQIENQKIAMQALTLPIIVEKMDDLVVQKLTKLGFKVEKEIKSSIITHIPSYMQLEEAILFVQSNTIQELESNNERYIYEYAALKSCKSALKANQRLTMLEALKIYNQLNECENNQNCPHGRPIFIKYERKDLDRLFKRIGI